MRRPAPLLLTIALVAVAPALGACGGSDEYGGPSSLPASSAPAAPVSLTGRSTTLALDPQTIGLLEDDGVTVTPIAPARLSAAGVRFPITGGEVRPDTLAGRIEHTGGIALTGAGGRRVVLRDLVIDAGSGQLTADAGAGRIPVLDLDVAAGTRADTASAVVLQGVAATLTAEAAQAVDDALQVTTLTPQLPIGVATVRATS